MSPEDHLFVEAHVALVKRVADLKQRADTVDPDMYVAEFDTIIGSITDLRAPSEEWEELRVDTVEELQRRLVMMRLRTAPSSVQVEYTIGSQSFTYDANGNQLTAGSDTFAWDAADRLESATVAGATATYAYAGDGRRLSVTSAGATTNWLWDLNFGLPQLALERTAAGAVVRRSTYGLGRIATISGAATAYQHHDGLGSLVDLTNLAGDPLAWSEYQPYGAVRTSGVATGAPAMPFGFAGEYSDPTGLLHLRARQYDPASGRFLSTDPVAPLLTDPYVGSYVYVRNNPAVWTDPSRLWTIGVCLNVNVNLFGVGGQLGGCVVAASSGQVGITVTAGGGGAFGARVSAGISAQVSDGNYVEDLAGPFYEVGGGASLGGGVQGSVFGGEGRCGQPVSGGSFGASFGAGAEVHGVATFTGILGTLGATAPPCGASFQGKKENSATAASWRVYAGHAH